MTRKGYTLFQDGQPTAYGAAMTPEEAEHTNGQIRAYGREWRESPPGPGGGQEGCVCGGSWHPSISAYEAAWRAAHVEPRQYRRAA